MQSEDLLHFPPAELFKLLLPFSNPLEFIQKNKTVFEKLKNGYQDDLRAAQELKPFKLQQSSAIYMLPNLPWAKRVSGVFGNQLASDTPSRAHANPLIDD